MNWAGNPPALVGFNAGDGVTSFSMPTSLTPGVLEVAGAGNTGSRGKWLFQVDRSDIQMPGMWMYSIVVVFVTLHLMMIWGYHSSQVLSAGTSWVSSRKGVWDFIEFNRKPANFKCEIASKRVRLLAIALRSETESSGVSGHAGVHYYVKCHGGQFDCKLSRLIYRPNLNSTLRC